MNKEQERKAKLGRRRLACLAFALSMSFAASGFSLFGPKHEDAPPRRSDTASPSASPFRDRGPRPGTRSRVMEIKIGAVLPLSGVVASDGEAAMHGLQIAEADINAAGDMPFRVRIIPSDGKFEPRESLNAFNLLLSQKVVGMLLIGDNTCQMTKMQVAKQEIPTIASMVVTERSLKGNRWMFRCWPPIATSAKIMARHMRMSGKTVRAAIFHIDAMYGLESAKGFTDEFKASGGQVVATESFPFLASDLRPQIAKLLQTHPEGLYVTGFGQGLITAINQLREAGWKETIYTDTAVVDPRVKKNLASLDKIVFVGNAFDEERAKGGAAADFAAKYRKLSKSETDEVPPQAPFAYMAARILVHGLAAARGSKPAVTASISDLRDFPSVLGPISYNSEREIVLPLYVKTFGPDGRNVLIDDKLWTKP